MNFIKSIILSIVITVFFTGHQLSADDAVAKIPMQNNTVLNSTTNPHELFQNFKIPGAPASSLCDDCRNDCGYCATYCWPSDGVCKTCGNNCPSNCSHCDECVHCAPGGECCGGFLDCDPKPSTCSSSGSL